MVTKGVDRLFVDTSFLQSFTGLFSGFSKHARSSFVCAIALAFVFLATDCSTSAPRSSRAALTGCLWFVSPGKTPGTLDLNTAELDAIQALGMNVVVLNGPFVGEKIADDAPDPALALFAEGDRRGVSFFLDTGSIANWWTLDDPKPELDRARARIKELHARYGHFKSFRGFYVPYELYVMWGKQETLIRTLYREVAAGCKQVAPTKPVLISPFFILDEEHQLGDFRWATPDDYRAFWTKVLGDSPVDIVALQDRGEHLSFYTTAQCAPFFAAMKAACDATGKTFWANVETGELHVASYDDYTKRFGAKTHVNDPKTQPYWRGVPVTALVERLAFVRRYTPTAITWGYREFVRPSLGPQAEALYRDYREKLAPEAVGR